VSNQRKKNQGLVEKKLGGQKTSPEEKGAAAGEERERGRERKRERWRVPVGLPNRSEKKNAYALEKFHPREQRTIVVP
jgi:hypothetical protein